MITLAVDDMDAVYDNSEPFSKYLKKQGLDDVLKKTKLRMRKKHRIVPHVCYSFPLKGAYANSCFGWCTAHSCLSSRTSKCAAWVFWRLELVPLCEFSKNFFSSLRLIGCNSDEVECFYLVGAFCGVRTRIAWNAKLSWCSLIVNVTWLHPC